MSDLRSRAKFAGEGATADQTLRLLDERDALEARVKVLEGQLGNLLAAADWALDPHRVESNLVRLGIAATSARGTLNAAKKGAK
jgi:hypothetical protein